MSVKELEHRAIKRANSINKKANMLIVMLILASIPFGIGIYKQSLIEITERERNVNEEFTYKISNKYDDFVVTGYTLEEMANSIVEQFITPEMSDYEMYKTLHDYIIDTSHYDYEGLRNENPDIHDGKSILALGKGVCDAYAYAYQALCEAAGLHCEVVIGFVDGEQDMHAWNIVKIGHYFYHVDVTWDDVDALQGKISAKDLEAERYEYFLVSDMQLKAKGRRFNTSKCYRAYEERQE